MCTYTSSKDEELMKTSNTRTRTGLKMHNVHKDKGKVEYIPYGTEYDGDDDFTLTLRSIYTETFDHWHYYAWPSDHQQPRVYEAFQFWGYNYMIRPSNIHGENLGLFIVQNVHVGSKHRNNSQQTTRRLILFMVHHITVVNGEGYQNKPSMSTCGLNSNMYTHSIQLESGK